MEDFSRPVETIAIPLAIPVRAYLADHRVSGRAVLPAVEALQALAGSLPVTGGADVLCQKDGRFDHLLFVGEQEREIPAIHEFSRYADGRCRSRLLTVLSGRQAAWTRKIEHASVFFAAGGGDANGMRVRRQRGDRTEAAGEGGGIGRRLGPGTDGSGGGVAGGFCR